jgi:hypothetical protein
VIRQDDGGRIARGRAPFDHAHVEDPQQRSMKPYRQHMQHRRPAEAQGQHLQGKEHEAAHPEQQEPEDDAWSRHASSLSNGTA